nr:glycosyltransferase [Paracraurococcus ruber]
MPPLRFLDGRRGPAPRAPFGYFGSANPWNIASVRALDAALAGERDLPWLLAGRILRRRDLALRSQPLRMPEVAEPGDFYDAAECVLNPMVPGTGLKIKTVEALAFGRPVIGTRWAFSGLPAEHPAQALEDVPGVVGMMREWRDSLAFRADLAAASRLLALRYAADLAAQQDALAARFRARCGLWRDVGHLDDAALAAQIAADSVDILLDLGGYGDGGRPGVLQQRPAPVQVKWVGMQNASMGLGCIDWMLTDRWETPAGFERFYAERLLRLPDGYVCYLPPPEAPPVGPLPALARGHVTFGCFNNLAKVTPQVLAAWARILAALPQARLVLRTHALGETATRERVLARMVGLGLPADRVVLEGGVPHQALLAAYGGIDIALDPFPYTGGLTVCEALWMGVPVLTLAGDSFCGRHALSHLSNVGLPDWAVTDAEAYVAAAIARASDLPALAALRAGLRDRVAASPLTDAAHFGPALAQALRRAWGEWCDAATPP